MIWKLMSKTIDNIWPMLTIFLVVIIAARVAYMTQHKEKIHFYKEILNLIFIIYVLILFGLLTSTEINNQSGVNLVPFTEIFRYEVGSELFMFNVLGNILIFVPFGYFIARYINGKKILPALIVALIASVTVEFVQLRIGRSFDIDDIILNGVGAIAGYLVYIGLSAIKRHLPSFLQKDFVYNIICLGLLGLIVFAILKRLGFGLGFWL